MDIEYIDRNIIVCVKPSGICSVDEPGGLPDLLRQELGNPHANIRTVHRLDQVVGGLIVLARSSAMASNLSEQIRDGRFHKKYLAVVHGCTENSGTMQDLLARDERRRVTYVTDQPGKDAREAILNYRTLGRSNGLSMVEIELVTGRTHQIRCQFSSRHFPLVGDRKYGLPEDDCPIALWSAELSFEHPWSGESVTFRKNPPIMEPWSRFTY